MHLYPFIVLPFGLLGLYVGLENLLMFALRRNRLHLWVGLLGLCTGPYTFTAFELYRAGSLADGSVWQRRQLLCAAALVYMLGMLGFDYIGQLKRLPVAALTVATIATSVLLWIPGAGIADTPSVKVLPSFGVTYYEMELGLSSQAFFGFAVVSLGWILVVAARRAWRSGWPDRMFVGVMLIWFAAAANDTAVAMGMYRIPYISEYAFALMAALFATLLFGEMHRTGMRAVARSTQLAREALVRDRQLAAVQAELTEAAKLAVVGRLAAGVAHEVNNPLSYVINNLFVLREQLPQGSDASQMAKEALEGAERIKDIVRQLSAYSRPPGTSSVGDVRCAAETATRLGSFELKDRAEVELDIPPRLTVALGEERLAQVLLNLVVNAAQSIAPGQKTQNRVRVRAAAQEGCALITVEDTGPGIPHELLPNIFDPFFTTKPLGQGTGLGLSISQEIVTKASGRIRAENVEPHGARFILELPIAAAVETPPQDASPTRPGRTAAGDRPTLLVVDDEVEVLRSLERVLSPKFQVQMVRSSAEAKDAIGEAQGFDLILCDLMMPQGNGLELLDWICEARPELASRVIIMTGGGLERQAIARAHRARPRLLPKPFTLRELSSLLAPPA